MCRFLILSCVFTVSLAVLEVNIIFSEPTQYVVPESSVTVVCEINDLGGKTVRWSHNNKLVALAAPGNSILYMDPNDQIKYNLVAGATNGGNFTLTINNFTRSDDGTISCDVTGADTAITTLEAIVASDIKITVEGKHKILKTNDQAVMKIRVPRMAGVSIICSVHGANPSPILDWQWPDGNMTFVAEEEIVQQSNGMFNASSTVYLSEETINYNNTMLYEHLKNYTLWENLTLTAEVDFNCTADIGGIMQVQQINLEFSDSSAEKCSTSFVLFCVSLGLMYFYNAKS